MRVLHLSVLAVCGLFLCCGVSFGQSTGDASSFEVALIKPPLPHPGSGAFTVRGGPGSSDPGLVTFTNIDLNSLIAMAFGIERHQISGPDWAGSTRFDITARLAPKVTEDQYRRMLQSLLAERFQLAFHRDTKVLDVYELVVGKGGAKLQATPIDADAANDGLQPPHPVPNLPPGFHGAVNVTLDKLPIESLVNDLEGLVGEPVEDATGLTGRYTVKLRVFFGTPPLGEEDLFAALEEQLGLRLVQKKRPIDIIEIDRLEKVPTEN